MPSGSSSSRVPCPDRDRATAPAAVAPASSCRRPVGPTNSRWCPPAAAASSAIAGMRLAAHVGHVVQLGSSATTRSAARRTPATKPRRSRLDQPLELVDRPEQPRPRCAPRAARRPGRPSRRSGGTPTIGAMPGPAGSCRRGRARRRTPARGRRRPDHVERHEQPDRDRQIEPRAGLAVRRRGEVDRDLLVGPSEAGRDHRRPYPIAPSRHDSSGRPSIANPGMPLATWTSTLTGWPRAPRIVAERTVAIISPPEDRHARARGLEFRRECGAPRQLARTISRGCRNATAAVPSNATLVGVLRPSRGSAAILSASWP